MKKAMVLVLFMLVPLTLAADNLQDLVKESKPNGNPGFPDPNEINSVLNPQKTQEMASTVQTEFPQEVAVSTEKSNTLMIVILLAAALIIILLAILIMQRKKSNEGVRK